MNRWLSKVKRFINALIWHISLGSPKSKQHQINTRYSLCIVCDSFDHKNSCCMECGCLISNKKRFMNKLAWADQKCPLGKWNSLV